MEGGIGDLGNTGLALQSLCWFEIQKSRGLPGRAKPTSREELGEIGCGNGLRSRVAWTESLTAWGLSRPLLNFITESGRFRNSAVSGYLDGLTVGPRISKQDPLQAAPSVNRYAIGSYSA